MRVMLAGLRPGVNGIDTYTRNVAEALAGHGDVELSVTAQAIATPVLTGARIVKLPDPRWWIVRALGPLEAQRTAEQIARRARETGGVVHSTLPELTPADTPTVTTFWHSDLGPRQRMRRANERGAPLRTEFLYAVSDGRSMRRSTVAIGVTPDVVAALKRAGHTDARLIPPCVPDRHLARPLRRRRSNTVVLIARRLDEPRKGLEMAIRAVAVARRQRRDLQLVLVGEVDGAAKLPDFCESVGLRSQPEVRALLEQRAGCLLLPSVFEEFGYVALEALAAGVPVVSAPLSLTRGLSTPSILQREREPHGLADGIHKALEMMTVDFPDECRTSSVRGLLVTAYGDALKKSGRWPLPPADEA